MATYVIADLHLSLGEGCNKSMEVFGRRWTGYTEKLERHWRALISPEDDVSLPGDISWSLTLEGAEADLRFIDNLPGRKLIGKGNHDFWWSSMTKMNAALEAWQLSTISFLYNSAIETDEYIATGSRGWFLEEEIAAEATNADFEKIVAREAGRLEMSLSAAKSCAGYGKKEVLSFLHFPPVWNGRAVTPFTDVLARHGVRRCYFGHIHGNYTAPPHFVHEGIDFILISADYLDFTPRIICQSDDFLPF